MSNPQIIKKATEFLNLTKTFSLMPFPFIACPCRCSKRTQTAGLARCLQQTLKSRATSFEELMEPVVAEAAAAIAESRRERANESLAWRQEHFSYESGLKKHLPDTWVDKLRSMSTCLLLDLNKEKITEHDLQPECLGGNAGKIQGPKPGLCGSGVQHARTRQVFMQTRFFKLHRQRR